MVAAALNSQEFQEESQQSKHVEKAIAIVEDDLVLCSLYSTLLQHLGHRIELVAHDGKEIVDAVVNKTVHLDLILMDYRMPLMNGLVAAEKILGSSPATRIVIQSADDSVKQEVISAGLFFLQKPFSASTLSKTIEDAFRHF